jgi:hypothetical protein
MLKTVQFTVGLLLLMALEILCVYSTLPLPGSQHPGIIDMEYFIRTNILYLRIVGLLIILFPTLYFFWMGTRKAKVLACIGLVAYFFLFYLINFMFPAEGLKRFDEEPLRALPLTGYTAILNENFHENQ